MEDGPEAFVVTGCDSVNGSYYSQGTRLFNPQKSIAFSLRQARPHFATKSGDVILQAPSTDTTMLCFADLSGSWVSAVEAEAVHLEFKDRVSWSDHLLIKATFFLSSVANHICLIPLGTHLLKEGASDFEVSMLYALLKLCRVLPICAVWLAPSYTATWHISCTVFGMTMVIINVMFPASLLGTAALCIGTGSSFGFCFCGQYISNITRGRPGLTEKLQFEGMLMCHSGLFVAMVSSGFIYSAFGWVAIAWCIVTLIGLQLVVIVVTKLCLPCTKPFVLVTDKDEKDIISAGAGSTTDDPIAANEGPVSNRSKGFCEIGTTLMWATLAAVVGANGFFSGAQVAFPLYWTTHMGKSLGLVSTIEGVGFLVALGLIATMRWGPGSLQFQRAGILGGAVVAMTSALAAMCLSELYVSIPAHVSFLVAMVIVDVVGPSAGTLMAGDDSSILMNMIEFGNTTSSVAFSFLGGFLALTDVVSCLGFFAGCGGVLAIGFLSAIVYQSKQNVATIEMAIGVATQKHSTRRTSIVGAGYICRRDSLFSTTARIMQG